MRDLSPTEVVLSRAGPETFLNDFLHEPGVTAPMKDPVLWVEAGIIPFYPWGSREITQRWSGSEASYVPHSLLGVLFSHAHSLLCRLGCYDWDTFKWKFSGAPLLPLAGAWLGRRKGQGALLDVGRLATWGHPLWPLQTFSLLPNALLLGGHASCRIN